MVGTVPSVGLGFSPGYRTPGARGTNFESGCLVSRAPAPIGVAQGQGRGRGILAKQDDQDNEIAAALDRLQVGGWSVGDTAFHDVDRGGIIHVVIGSNCEN